jgi:predicted phage tail component-like protein
MRFNGVDSRDLGVVCLPQSGVFMSARDDDVVKLPGADGQVFFRSAQQARTFTVDLWVPASSRAEAAAKWDAVAAWLAAGPAPLVFDELPDRCWTARLESALEAVSGGSSFTARQLGVALIADDPHPKAVVDDTAAVTAAGPFAVHRTKGNMDSRPRLVLQAVLAAGQTATVRLGGRQVVLAGPLTEKERAVFDFERLAFTITDAAGVPVRLAVPQMPGLADALAAPLKLAAGDTAGSVAVSGGNFTKLVVECNSRWL